MGAWKLLFFFLSLIASQDYVPLNWFPVVYDVNPKSVGTRGNTVITIDGYNLITPGNTKAVVSFRYGTDTPIECPLTTGTQTSRQIRCTLPAGAGLVQLILSVLGKNFLPLPTWPNGLFFVDNALSIPSGTTTGCVQVGNAAVMNYKYWNYNVPGQNLPDTPSGFDSYGTPTLSGTVTSGSFDIGLRTQDNDFVFTWSGALYITKNGTYTFYLNSDDGSRLWIDNLLVVNNNGAHGATEQSGARTLTVGSYNVFIAYCQGGGEFSFSASYFSQNAGITKQTIPLGATPSTPGYGTGWVSTPNYFCTQPGYGFEEWKWSPNGAITNVGGIPYSCFSTVNPASNLFPNPYICKPTYSPYNLTFSAGGISPPDKACVKWFERTDPNWSNGNEGYLCADIGTPYGVGNDTFMYPYALPRLDNVSPLNGPTAGTKTITINGTNFGPNVARVTVKIGSYNCAIQTNTFSHEYIVCTLGQGEGKVNNVVVTVFGRSNTNPPVFRFDAPVISGVNPSTYETSGGGTLTISGSNFGTTWGTVAVGTGNCEVTAWGDTQVRCKIPSGAGVADVKLSTSAPPQQSNPWSWSYQPPQINSIVPNADYTGGSTTMIVRGTSFGTTGNVTIAEKICSILSWNDTVITCQIPAGQGIDLKTSVVVTGKKSNEINFSYYPPVISGIQPTSGLSGPGVLVTLTGTSFGTTGLVKLGGNTCSFVPNQYDHTRIICTLPSGVGYMLDTNVTVSGQVSNNIKFSYLPVITTVTAPSKPTAGTVPITITGTSYTTTANTIVTIGTSTCTNLNVNATQITCTLPAGEGVNRPIYVTVSGIQGPSLGFTYDPPEISSINPTGGPATANYNVTISGSNFGFNPSVAIGGVPCDITQKNHTVILCVPRVSSGANLNLIVTVAGQNSNARQFSYFPPDITSIEPSNGPTAGNIPVTIYGTGFSGDLQVLVGTQTVNVPSSQVTSSYLVFNLPAGGGYVNVIVKVGLQTSNVLFFSYDAPTITSIEPFSGATDGTSEITLHGQNFGVTPAVTVGGFNCPLLGTIWNSTYLICRLPKGSGTVPVYVISAGQSAPQPFYFNYSLPTISSITPTSGDTPGGGLLQIFGSNFATSGNAYVGSNECFSNVPSGSWTDKKIVCQLPSGQGSTNVVSVRVFNPWFTGTYSSYKYNAPTISEVVPSNSPTAGNVPITVRGLNFGTNATVTIGGSVCTQNFVQTHSQIQCLTPAGKGINQALVVQVADQSASTTFNYDKPTITSITPTTGPTQGNINITLGGVNMGTAGAPALILTLAGSTVTTWWLIDHNTVVFNLPEGTGLNKLIELNVASQTATSTAFSYQAPSLTSVSIQGGGASGSCLNSGNAVVDCPIAGNIVLTLTGSNFGTNQAVVSVTVGGVSATIQTVTHTTILALLPANLAGGFTLPVKVTVDGQSDTKNLVSYSGPIFTAGTLIQTSPVVSSTPGAVTISTDAPNIVQLTGKFWGTDEGVIQIKFGLPSTAFEDKPYTCPYVPGSIEFISGDQTSKIRCTLDAGAAGQNLVFQIQVGLQVSQETVDTLSYPAPVIFSGTIRLNDIGAQQDVLAGSDGNSGDQVYFKVENTGNRPELITVQYFQVDTSVFHDCPQVTVTNYGGDNTIGCVTQPGFGDNYIFRVFANGIVSNNGTDLYRYAQPRVVYTVAGCTNNGNRTEDCPTSGNRLLTITGDNIGPLGLTTPVVTIGTYQCLNVNSISSQTLTCILPQGVGVNLQIVVQVGKAFSAPVAYLSYAGATVTSLASSGCAKNGNNLLACPRQGGVSLTMTGSNFGSGTSGPASIFIGGSLCTNVVHDSSTPHSRLTCTLPSGSRLLQAVVFLQNGGVLSTQSVTVGYLQCSVGTYLSEADLNCYNCPPATYMDQEGARGNTSCKPCQSGFYETNGGASACLPCSPGYYSVFGNTATCTPCAAGTYNSFDSQSACVDCLPGSYADHEHQVTCKPCPTGTEMPQSGATECTPCAPGYYASLNGTLTCLPCEAGYATSANTTTVCGVCAAGTYSGPGATSCTNCTAGFFTSTSAQPACTSCAPGYYTNQSGLTLCSVCPKGTTSIKTSLSGPQSCSPCPMGTYGATDGQPFCVECPQGSFGNVTGLTACYPCELGTAAYSTNNYECTPCLPNTYAPTIGSLTCKSCEIGKYVNSTGAAVCIDCPPGFYRTSTQTTCQPCPEGTHQSTGGQALCLDCEDGKFSNTTGNAECTLCSPGFYVTKAPSGAIRGATACKPCAAGTVTTLPGQYVCGVCPVGFYQPSTGQQGCLSCEVGKKTETQGNVACTNCTKGFYASEVASPVCNPCLEGTYAENDGQASCDLCGPGKYSQNLRSTHCNDCELGKFTAGSKQTSCSDCKPGYFANTTGAAACIECPPGYYQPNSLASQCIPCSAGTFSVSSAQTICQQCATGTVQPLTGKTACDICPMGKYYNATGGTECTGCAKGYFSAQTSTFLCEPCDIGKYNNAENLTECYPCEAGKYQPLTAQASCIMCPPGSAQPASGQASCQICDDGKFANTTFQIQCEPCPMGRSVQHSSGSIIGPVTCDVCLNGTYADALGLASCKSCPVGTYAPFNETIECTLCEPGKYSTTGAGSDGCVPCPPGSFTAVNGSLVCNPCGLGYYTNTTGNTECVPCLPGLFSSKGNSTRCEACPLGFYSSDHAEICTPCLPGLYANRTGASTCDSCPPGYFQDGSGATNCTICDYGEFAADSNSKVCEKCPVGRFGNQTGASECFLCTAGQYQAEKGKLSCNLCIPGKISDITREGCIYCPDKQIAPNNGSAICGPCPSQSDSNGDFTKCLCKVGFASYYSPSNPEAGPDGFYCRPCPRGGDCTRAGVNWTEMEALPGYWEEGNKIFYPCVLSTHCVGGSVTNTSAVVSVFPVHSPCDSNRNGPLCAICNPGYVSVLGGQCQKCQSEGVTWVALFLIATAVIVAGGGMMYVVLRSGKDLIRAAIRHEEYKRREDLGFVQDYDPEYEFLSNRYGDRITIKGAPAPKPNFTFKMKIVLGFAQILSTMAIALEIQWPMAFKNFVIWLVPSNLDFVQVSTLGCIYSFNYYTKLLLMCLLPAALLLLLTGLYLLPKYWKYQKDGSGRKLARRKFWRLLLFFLFIIYPSVSSVILRTYVCRKVEGITFLLADFTLVCSGSTYVSYATFAAFMILVYPLGIPTFFFIMVYRYRDRLQEPGTRAELGFLFDAYNGPMWWFETLDMAHKLLVTSIVAFFPFKYQMPAALVIVYLYLSAIYLLKPYIRKSDDRLHLLGQVELLLLLLAGNVFNQLDEDPSATSETIFGIWTNDFRDQFISAIMILLVILFFTYFVIQSLQWISKLLKNWLSEKRRVEKEDMERMERSVNSEKMTEFSRTRGSPEKERTEKEGEELFATTRRELRPLTHATRKENLAHPMSMVGNPLWNVNAPVHDPEGDIIREVHTNPLNQAIVLRDQDIDSYTSDQILSLSEFVGDGEYIFKTKEGEQLYVSDVGDEIRLTRRIPRARARRDSDPDDVGEGTNFEEQVVAVKAKENKTGREEKRLLKYDFDTYSVKRTDRVLPSYEEEPSKAEPSKREKSKIGGGMDTERSKLGGGMDAERSKLVPEKDSHDRESDRDKSKVKSGDDDEPTTTRRAQRDSL